jgi:Fe-S cluster assembly ATP-binding protein
MTILNIKNLTASINNNSIINNLNLVINENEIHILMGSNGSGKSTLSKILAGHPLYTVTSGEINFLNKNLLTQTIEERAQNGLFLAFQHPLEIPGITNFDFFLTIFNNNQKQKKCSELDPLSFLKKLNPYLDQLGIKPDCLYRNFNEGFSGGEKKRNELIQLFLLTPQLIILDELDSGLDLDSLKFIFNHTLSVIHSSAPKPSFLIITHNPKIVTALKPNYIHIMNNGTIKRTGNLELLEIIEKQGYIFNT